MKLCTEFYAPAFSRDFYVLCIIEITTIVVKLNLWKCRGIEIRLQLQNLFQPIVDFIPFLGSFINSHEIKIGLPTFAPFFHHFFKTKYFFQKLKALERDKVVFHFYFFSPNVWVITLCYYLLAYQKRVVQKASYFFILLSLFLGFKNEISFHIFHIAFFSFINISSCKMICNSFFSLVKLWCNRVDFFYTIIVGKSKKDSVVNSK